MDTLILNKIKKGLIEDSKRFYKEPTPSYETFWKPYHEKIMAADTLDEVKALAKSQFHWGDGELDALIEVSKNL